MSSKCTHLDQIKNVTPSAKGCEECGFTCGNAWCAETLAVVIPQKIHMRRNTFRPQIIRLCARLSPAKIGAGVISIKHLPSDDGCLGASTIQFRH
jgi:hypothetical protein